MSRIETPTPSTAGSTTWWGSIRLRFILCFSLVFAGVAGISMVLSLTGVPFVPSWSGHVGVERTEVFRALNLIADLKKEQLERWIEERRGDAHLVAGNPFVGNAVDHLLNASRMSVPPDETGELGATQRAQSSAEASRILLRRFLDDVLAEHDVYDTIRIIDIDTGVLLLSTDAADSVSYEHVSVPHGVRWSFGALVADVALDPSGHPTFQIMHSIPNSEGDALAVLIMDVNMDDIIRPMLHTGGGLGRTGEVLLVNPDARILTSLKYSPPDQTEALLLQYQLQTKHAEYAARGEEGIVEARDYRGEPVLAAYRHIRVSPALGWGLVVKRDRSDAFAPVREAVFHGVLVSALGALTVIVLTIFITRALTAPILELNRVARRVSEGHLDARANVSSWDEMGELASSFNAMIHRLQHWNRELEEQVADRTVSLEQSNAQLVGEITEHRRTGEALRSSEERARSIVDTALDAVITMDEDGIVIGWNPRAEEIFGYSQDEAVGVKLANLVIPPESRAAHEQGLANLLATPEGPFVSTRMETIALRRNGEEFPVDLSVSSLMIGEKQVFSGFVHDITDRKRAEEEKTQLRDELHQAQKMEAVGQLAGGVAHDFNNLLQIILAHAEFVLDSAEPNSDIDQSISEMMDAVKHATGVTRSLLTFSGKVRVEKQLIDLCSAVDQSVKMLWRTLPATIELVVDTDCKPTPWVNADQTQLQQIIINLAVNARDAMPGGGTLRISVAPPAASSPSQTSNETDAPFARLVVSDTGTGMPPEVQERIFEPFFTTKERGQGSGLGMAIIHSIVEDHAGRITVESEVGAGTTFTIHLPCVSRNLEACADRLEAVVPQGRGEMILLAEDNKQVRNVIAATLVSLGYEVLQAADGDAILEIVQQRGQEIELFIIDVDLPKRSGLDCLRTIRTEGSQTPAIVITGSPEVKLDDEPHEHTLLLPKPFSMNQLGTLVTAQLQQTAAGRDEFADLDTAR